jgi:hypothetical protein
MWTSEIKRQNSVALRWAELTVQQKPGAKNGATRQRLTHLVCPEFRSAPFPSKSNLTGPILVRHVFQYLRGLVVPSVLLALGQSIPGAAQLTSDAHLSKPRTTWISFVTAYWFG